MFQSRQAEKLQAASADDLFADTDLSQAPGDGVIGIWAGSDQVDHYLSARVGGQALLANQLVPFRGTSAPIAEEQEAPVAWIQCYRGDLVKVDFTIGTAGLTRVVAIWVGVL